MTYASLISFVLVTASLGCSRTSVTRTPFDRWVSNDFREARIRAEVPASCPRLYDLPDRAVVAFHEIDEGFLHGGDTGTLVTIEFRNTSIEDFERERRDLEARGGPGIDEAAVWEATAHPVLSSRDMRDGNRLYRRDLRVTDRLIRIWAVRARRSDIRQDPQDFENDDKAIRRIILSVTAEESEAPKRAA